MQQGDPLGPLLFSLALQPLLVQLGNVPGLELSFFYLDDLVLAREQSAVAAGIPLLRESAASLGLQLLLGLGHVVLQLPGAARPALLPAAVVSRNALEVPSDA